MLTSSATARSGDLSTGRGAALPEGPARPSMPPRPASTEREGYPGATLALASLTLLSTAGLFRVFSDDRWLGPVLLTAVLVHAVAWAARRWRFSQLAALAASLAALWIVTGWTVLGSSTFFGFPGAGTAAHLWTGLERAHSDFAAAVTPVTTTTGYTLLAVLGAGLVAILGDWAAFRWRSALYGALPAFAYFVVCSCLGEGPGREWAVALEVIALLVFLVVHRATVGRADQAWFGNQRTGTARWAVRAGCLAGAASLATALAITPAAGGTEGHGILGWRGGFGEAGSGPRQVPNPIVDLHTRLLVESDTPVFKVESPVPSYWRLTSLDTFTGQDWISTNSYRSFGAHLPGVQAVPAGTRLVEEHFQVQGLGSVWLPDAFTPVAVSGVHHVSYDPVSGSLITSHPTSNGLAYAVESYQYLSDLDPAQLESAPPVSVTSAVRSYLELPKSVPADVYALARRITAGQTTEYGKALALQNFFQGPSFTYSLSPPDDGYGISALTTFLFDSRTGYCQQFAGAYAVLARAIGLPTRLAVGFATGTDEGNGTYQVLDADAHTWPEVYFGPSYGWLPFEPTKSYVDPMSEGYAPSSTGGSTGPAVPTEPILPIPKGLGVPPGLAGGGSAGPTTTVGGGQATGQATSHHRSALWSVLLVLLLVLIGWICAVAALRRGRWVVRRWAARGDPAAVVRSHWADVTEMLSWWGATPAAGETDEEYAGRAGRLLVRRLREPSPWLPAGVRRLAHLATEAAFAPSVPAARVDEAAMVASEIRQGLFRTATARQLIVWGLVPQPGLRFGSRSDQPWRRSGGEDERAHGPWLAKPARAHRAS